MSIASKRNPVAHPLIRSNTRRPQVTHQPSGPIAYKLSLRANSPHRPFADRDFCVYAWRTLQDLFPEVIAAVLMPNHLHITAWPASPESNSKNELTDLLRQFQRRMSFKLPKSVRENYWEPIYPPEGIPDPFHLQRQIRYVHLNPCRRSLCRDPLGWEWSTHRDYVGAIANPWPERERVFKLLTYPSGDRGLERFHCYISSDPSVSLVGTHLPRQAGDSVVLLNLSAAEKAAALALRIPATEIRRKGRTRHLVLGSIQNTFIIRKNKIAQHFGVHPSSIRTLDKPDIDELALGKAIGMTLMDSRLLGEFES